MHGPGDWRISSIEHCDPGYFRIQRKCLFRDGRGESRRSEDAILKSAALHLKSDPNLVVECAGFTDDAGSDASNQKLSARRAQQVRMLLIKKYGAEAKR